MPRETFQILVEVLNSTDANTAIATASSYLAYADQTDTIGYNPAYTDVRTLTDKSGDHPLSVELTVAVTIQDDDHLREFMNELTNLSRVMSVERQ